MGWVIFIIIVFVAAFIAQMVEDKKKYGTWGLSREEMKYIDTMKIIAQSNLPTQTTIQMAQNASDTFQADVSKKIEKKQTTKAMVKGAVVGGIVGGDAGAVVGAMIGKENAKK